MQARRRVIDIWEIEIRSMQGGAYQMHVPRIRGTEVDLSALMVYRSDYYREMLIPTVAIKHRDRDDANFTHWNRCRRYD